MGVQKKENIYRASGKFKFLDRILPRLWEFKHKTLIFSQTTTLLDMLEKLLKMKDMHFARIDGTMRVQRRRLAIQRFRDAEVGILLLTTRAGGVGLNLQMADTVILLDSDWNPQADVQAMDRAHRLGQKNPVRIIRLMTPTGLDEGILKRN